MTIAARLLRWYARHGRDLPWRHTRDPYRILVSEMMLQQTQVPRVLLFYRTWLQQFPDWHRLAQASTTHIIHAWAGLGYNRRALTLRDIARHVDQHGEPKTEKDWLALKGIGPYTAEAIAAFSLHERTLPIDTNIRRVLGRVLLGQPFPQLKDDARLQKKTESFLPKNGKYYDVPQALFDLATSICTKRPACAICPLRNDCKAAPRFLEGRVRIPNQSIAKAKENIRDGKRFPDRIFRGRILTYLRQTHSPVDLQTLGENIDAKFEHKQDTPWIKAMVERMKKDGLVEQRGTKITLAR